MWTGTSALKNIDQSLQSLRNEVVRLDTQLEQLTSHMGAKQRHRAKLINDIANVRLSEIESGELKLNFNAADEKASELLDQREHALADLSSHIESVNGDILDAENLRDGLLEAFNQASEKIVEIEGQVQAQLKTDPAYMSQFKQAQMAQSVADRALQKMQRAQANMAAKAEPYQADPLFMYLWGAAYGTTDYNGGLIARFVDGWVAKTINYEPSRVNYWNLVEIPKRLNEHAERVDDQAEVQHSLLSQIEISALEAAGTRTLDSELDSLRLKVDAHDDTIEALEIKLSQYLDQRNGYVAGEDKYIKQCLERISSSLEHQNLDSIHHYVRETISPTDDLLVIELQTLDDSLSDVEGDLVDVRSLHDRRLDKLRELEKVRRDFKNSRFDDVRSGFGNQALINTALSQFLQGVVSGSDVWRVIKRNQRYRNIASDPSFGSGGFGGIADAIGGEIMRQGRNQRRSKRSSTWHWPKPRGGGGGFTLPRGGGGRSGGGFKTGGGF